MQNGKATQIYLSNENRDKLAQLPKRTASALVNELITAYFSTDTMSRNMATFRALLISAEFEIETKGTDDE